MGHTMFCFFHLFCYIDVSIQVFRQVSKSHFFTTFFLLRSGKFFLFFPPLLPSSFTINVLNNIPIVIIINFL